MTWQITAYSSMYLLTGTVALVTAWINWRRRSQPGLASLARSMLFVTLWAVANGCELAVLALDSKIFFLILENLACSIFTNYMLLFILEYYHLDHLLTPFRHRLLWLAVLVSFILHLTNPWHHWIWTGFRPGPPGSNLIFPEHGPFYFLTIAYMDTLVVLMVATLVREAFRSQNWDRQRAVMMVASLVAPLAGYAVYTIGIDETAGLILMPLGISLSGMLITSIVFEDLHHQLVAGSVLLQNSIQELQNEIQNRKQLENDLRQTKDSLAARLAHQSRKLAGLYDLILLSSQELKSQDLLGQLLERVQTILGCEAVGYFSPAAGGLRLEAQRGLSAAARSRLEFLPAPTPDDWQPAGHDVRAEVDLRADSGRLPEVRAAGFRASLCKWVNREHQEEPGLLMALWQAPHLFGVEEIALFGASTDAVSIILENARLREQIAAAAIQQERRRLARDLHDSVTQSLHSLVFSAETASELLETNPAGLGRILTHLAASARLALKEMRLLLYELRLAPLETGSVQRLGLVNAICNRLEAVERRAGVAARLVVEDGLTWPAAWEPDLYSIAMESLNNAIKHAQAGSVEIHLQRQAGCFEMQIRDDGCGFDPQACDPGGLGLSSMAERAERLGGRLAVQSQPGAGACISVVIPS